MKNTLIFSLLGAGAMALGLASCAGDDMPSPVNNGNQLTFEVSLPEGMQTRAFADGLSATNLKVALYDASKDGEAPVISNFEGGANASQLTITPLGDLKYRVSVPLASGVNYNVVFWAQSYADGDTSNPYTFTPTTKSISVDYSKMQLNTEATDAFYAYVAGIDGSASSTTSVMLYRPFAQINVGTGDMQAYVNSGGTAVTTAALSFSNLATDFNLATSQASGSADDVTYPAAALPTDETFPAGTGMQYLAMAYVLVGDDTAEKAQINTVGLYLNGAATAFASYENIPAQRNYRTNIYGNLLTNVNNFEVTIDPAFLTPDNNVEPWSGEITTPTADANGNYAISKPSDLAGIADMVNKGNTLEGKTIKLSDDIDLGDNGSWVPIGTEDNPFAGEFDAQSHTVKGVKNTLFGSVSGANIHDATVEASSPKYAALAQRSSGATTITNVTVTGTVSGSSHAEHLGAAGFVSRVMSGPLTLDNCTNKATIIDDDYVAGGLIGSTETKFYDPNAPETMVKVKNSNNYGSVTSNRPSGGKAAGIIALPATFVEITDCNNYGPITVNSETMAAAAGAIGWSAQPATITGFNNTADITTTTSAQSEFSAAGGVFGGTGWLNYTLTISGCSNSGKISASCNGGATDKDVTVYQNGVYAGGIIGMVDYGTVIMTDNTSSGNVSVQSYAGSNQYQGVSGLAGGLGWLNALTITGNKVGNITVTGNMSPLVSAYYNLNGNAPTTLTMDSNTNATSYAETAKK